MMSRYTESDLLPISALQHLIYCPRQCALIHNEQQWAENRLTTQGKQLHAKAHDGKQSESRPDIRIARGLPLYSFEHGLTGYADVVEFHPHTQDDRSNAEDPGPSVRPIEYKRGKPKPHDADKVQLCAQALCLEEMLKLERPIADGRLFYGKTRRRQNVILDPALRRRTLVTIVQLRELFDTGRTPSARHEKYKCDRCSLLNLCMPRQLAPRRTARVVFEQSLRQALKTT